MSSGPDGPDDDWDASQEGGASYRLDEEYEQRQLLRRAQDLAGMSLEQLWLRYFGLGGDVGLVEVEAYLAGMLELPALQRDMLAQAVNERLDEIPPPHVPYSHSVRPAAPSSAELTALADLLSASHLASPDDLPDLADAAFSCLGVGVTVYLVDHDQQLLVPLGARAGRGRRGAPRALGIDSTLAGRAFQSLKVLGSDTEEHPRLWLPLLDGTERLGVLEVHLSEPSDLLDIVLHEQCQHVGSLVGHLVTTLGRRGDALDTPRRRRPRDPSAELLWQLLPPPTAENGSLSLSGWLAPADTAGGDAFDYSLHPDRAALVLLDAMGHGLPAAMLAAAALSAYRSARRNGRGLLAQAAVVDSVVCDINPDGGFVTGFLAELDLVSGRLRYLNAGHPDPLLLRGGRVVKTLTGGRTVPFGLGAMSASPAPGPVRPDGRDDDPEDDPDDPDERFGHEDLQPGDWLVVYTDGVTEARDAAGTFFGEARLTDLLERATAAGHPPPETARRLAHAVMAHQDDNLQDDATVLLARWDPRW